MNVIATTLPDVLILEPKVFGDERGFFFESFNERDFAASVGDVRFVQDNHSKSRAGVLRGLHYQIRQPQGKLVRVIAGEIFDVAVDIRKSSPTFGRWAGVMLSAANRRQMWIPPGFAHGFVVVGESAEVLYKTTDYWAAEHERCIRWDDPALGIDWPQRTARLSARDAQLPPLAELQRRLPFSRPAATGGSASPR
jgi:dTDP-4-dehydrorhamnose 3,5-epimerase